MALSWLCPLAAEWYRWGCCAEPWEVVAVEELGWGAPFSASAPGAPQACQGALPRVVHEARGVARGGHEGLATANFPLLPSRHSWNQKACNLNNVSIHTSIELQGYANFSGEARCISMYLRLYIGIPSFFNLQKNWGSKRSIRNILGFRCIQKYSV